MYIDENSKVMVQGITGNQGRFHTKLMLDYGTNIVAGVTPKKEGEKVHGIPVYNSVANALKETSVDASIIFVPARFCFDAIQESIDAGIKQTCIITEGIPVQDMVILTENARRKGVHLVGPNSPGILIPEKIKLGIMPSDLCRHGDIEVITKSGTLSYEIVKSIDL